MRRRWRRNQPTLTFREKVQLFLDDVCQSKNSSEMRGSTWTKLEPRSAAEGFQLLRPHVMKEFLEYICSQPPSDNLGLFISGECADKRIHVDPFGGEAGIVVATFPSRIEKMKSTCGFRQIIHCCCPRASYNVCSTLNRWVCRTSHQVARRWSSFVCRWISRQITQLQQLHGIASETNLWRCGR